MRDPQLEDLPFIPARQFKRGPAGGRQISTVVLHDAECTESQGAARAVARYFAGLDRKASAHFVVDNREIIACVRLQDIAYHAPPNANSVGIELCGYARQTPAEWDDAYSRAELELAQELVAELCDRLSLPPVFVGAGDIRSGMRGITTHAEMSKAYRMTDHTDPGASFPMEDFVARVQNLLPYPASR